jgi:hypothetical protein
VNIKPKKAMKMYIMALCTLLGLFSAIGLVIMVAKTISVGYEPKDAGLIAICSLMILGCAGLYAKMRAKLYR